MDDNMSTLINQDNTDGRVKLKRNIGVWTGMSIVVGSMIGSGIFVSTKGVLLGAGSIGLSLIIWLVCGIVAILGSLVYVELGCMLPKAGGDYEYINQAFGSIPSFLFAWSTVLCFLHSHRKNFFGYTRNTCGQLYKLRSPKVLALVIIIGIGVAYAVKTKLMLFRNPFEVKVSNSDRTTLILAIYSGLYSFAGWNTLNFIGEEIKHPERDMPIAIVSGISLTTIIYVLVNAAYFVLLTPQEIVESNAIAVTYSEVVWVALGNIMSGFVALSTFGYLNGMTMATSRIAFSAARRHHMPRFMCLINCQNKLPICAVVSTTVISILLLFIGDLYRLISIASCCEYIFILLSVIGMLVLRRRRPDWNRPFRVPIWIAVFFSASCIFVIIMTFYYIPLDGLICVGFNLLGLIIYAVCKKNEFVNRRLAIYAKKLENILQKLTLSEFDLSN
ncbi:hypothetical protein GJ496_007622 [Pomphorhynchus laevis]|nr:hypothetical protein GJ496_007622 [Pomphorhynchus laevis]